MNYPYSLIIRWSDEDKLYLVTLPEFSTIAMQPCTHGTTYQEAVQNAQEAIEGYILYCQNEQIPIPEADRLQVA